MLSVAALGALLGAVAPMTPQAPVVLNGVLAGVGAALVVLVLRVRRRAVLHLGTCAVIAGVTAIISVAATPAGAAGTAISYVWVPLYAGFFFSRRLARTYVGAVAIGFAGALLLNPFPGIAHVWVLVVATSAAAAEVVGRLVDGLRTQATTDPLTGLPNREGLRLAAERLTRTAGRRGELTLVLLDLDGFKAVNDTYGHEAGDDLLLRVADGWRRDLRAGDVAARLGGDEFVLLLPGMDLAQTVGLLTRLRTSTPDISWSVGVAPYRPGASLASVLREADARLYDAKRARGTVAIPAQRRAVPLAPVSGHVDEADRVAG